MKLKMIQFNLFQWIAWIFFYTVWIVFFFWLKDWAPPDWWNAEDTVGSQALLWMLWSGGAIYYIVRVIKYFYEHWNYGISKKKPNKRSKPSKK